MDKEKEISPLKQYRFPAKLRVVRHKGKIIVIAIDTANWIVLENEAQLTFFQLLQQFALEEALARFTGKFEDAQYTVIQVEARNFEFQDIRPIAYGKVMQFHLTNGCNMRCPHCYMHSGEKADELTTEEIFEVLEHFRAGGGDEVTFTGGEVRMRKDLLAIVKKAFSLGLGVVILTNGTLWDKTLIRAFAPYLKRVQISVDGFSEEENARVRGKGNFTKALQAIDDFLQADVPTDIGITQWFDDELERKANSFSEFGKSLLKKYAGKPFNIRYTSELLDGRDIHFSAEEKLKYEMIVNKIYIDVMGNEMDMPFVELHRKHLIDNNCEFGNLTIESNGNVYFCPTLSVLPTTVNVRTHTFQEIWEYSKQATKVSDIDNLEPCRHCHLKYICGGGGCRIKFFKDFHKEESYKIAHHPQRYCSQEVKDEVYDLMLRTNELLFQ